MKKGSATSECGKNLEKKEAEEDKVPLGPDGEECQYCWPVMTTSNHNPSPAYACPLFIVRTASSLTATLGSSTATPTTLENLKQNPHLERRKQTPHDSGCISQYSR